jgi:hypothetical protein
MYLSTNNTGDTNLVHVLENSHTLERMRILTSILAAVLAGLFDVNLYGGVGVYIGLHLIITLLIFVTLKGRITDFFLKELDLLGGLGSGVLAFLCVWIIVYNIVYTL